MFTEKTVKPPRRWSNAGVVIGLLLLMIIVMPVVRAQEAPITPQDIQVRRKAALHSRGKGKIIAEGKNKHTLEQVPVQGYTIEELELDEPVEAEIDGKKTEVYQAYRITVVGGPFNARATPLLLKIGDKTTLWGVEAPKLDKVTFILYDRSLLLEGPKLTVGYGPVTIDLTDKLILGETRN